MIKLGKLTDYALVIMSQLANEKLGSAHSSVYLSEITKIPEPTVAKVLKQLTRSKLVVSRRGVNGGYLMKHKPMNITVLGIIEALEGPVNVSSWSNGLGEVCASDLGCPIQGSWHKINEAIREALQRVSLADLAIGCGTTCSTMNNAVEALQHELKMAGGVR